MSMAPVGELRLAIPVGLAVFKLDVAPVLIVSIIGNMVPVVLLLFFLKTILSYDFKKVYFFKKAIDWWQIKAKEKHMEKIQEYGAIELMLFVAIPLPMTGAWTGALLATLMNLPIQKSLPAIFAGVAMSGVIVILAMVLGINIQEYFDWQVLLAVILSVMIIYLYLKRVKKI